MFPQCTYLQEPKKIQGALRTSHKDKMQRGYTGHSKLIRPL